MQPEAMKQAIQAAQAAEDKALHDEATRLTGSLKDEIQKAVAAIYEAVVPPNVAAVHIDAAKTVVAARRTHAEAVQVLQDAEARRDSLKGRLDDLATEREVIAGRRSRGDARDSDRSDLLLIDVDREGVEGALGRANAEVDRLRAEVQTAAQAMAGAERRWSHDCEIAWNEALSDSAQPCETALVAISRAFAARRMYAGGSWKPTRALSDIYPR